MRYTRGKQVALYVCKGNNTRYKEFKEIRGYLGNLTIRENITSTSHCNRIDPTFIWRRKALTDGRNTVFFGSFRVVKVKNK
ncbi:hypothetical protein CN646_07620 [Bacillus wiedmannii]|nr:hypothetical protein CN646_07620 [Bacillus wiedmannii]